MERGEGKSIKGSYASETELQFLHHEQQRYDRVIVMLTLQLVNLSDDTVGDTQIATQERLCIIVKEFSARKKAYR